MPLLPPVPQHAVNGVPDAIFRQIKVDMLEKGVFNPNYWEEMNSYQRFWITETKKTLRRYKNEQLAN